MSVIIWITCIAGGIWYLLLGYLLTILLVLDSKKAKTTFQKYGVNRQIKLLIIILLTIFWLPYALLTIFLTGAQSLLSETRKLIVE